MTPPKGKTMTNVTPPPAHSPLGDQRGECKSIGYLVVGGRKVGLLRCGEPAGHHTLGTWAIVLGSDGSELKVTEHFASTNGIVPLRLEPSATAHRAVLTWEDEVTEEWPELYDPNETFDVDVPAFDAKVLPPLEADPSTADESVDLYSRPYCPECQQGKHGNCDGTTWDNYDDAAAPCPCPCRKP